MPGILEGRLREDGLSAGRTSSPDFLRTIEGFLGMSSSESSETDIALSADLDKAPLGSVLDLEWEILRGSEVSPSIGVDIKPFLFASRRLDICDGNTKISPAVSVLLGEPSRCWGIALIASWSSFRLINCLPRSSTCSSSSLFDEEPDSGGEMMAPAGIIRASVTGGGDCRTAGLLATNPFRSSDVPGGVISGVVPLMGGFDTADGVRLCLVRYDADRGSEGLDGSTGLE